MWSQWIGPRLRGQGCYGVQLIKIILIQTFEIWRSRLFSLTHSEKSAWIISSWLTPSHFWAKDQREVDHFPWPVKSFWRASALQGLELWKWASLSQSLPLFPSLSLSLGEGFTGPQVCQGGYLGLWQLCLSKIQRIPSMNFTRLAWNFSFEFNQIKLNQIKNFNFIYRIRYFFRDCGVFSPSCSLSEGTITRPEISEVQEQCRSQPQFPAPGGRLLSPEQF